MEDEASGDGEGEDMDGKWKIGRVEIGRIKIGKVTKDRKERKWKNGMSGDRRAMKAAVQ